MKTTNETNEYAFHNDAITSFNQDLYSDVFTEENITSKKKSITVAGDKFYGFFLEKGKENYFCSAEWIDRIPFKLNKVKEIDFKGDVFKALIEPPTSINIPSEQRLTIRQLIDNVPNFKHTNPLHFKLYKLVCFTAYVDRVNARIATDAGFGKDSLINIISGLVDSTANIYGATFAKLEYNLRHKLLVFNEMGNLKEEDKQNMQEFLLATGAYFNVYNKRTRKSAGTQEQYDISRTSLLILSNLPSYYIAANQEYFDKMFQKAVINRFIPFVFEGVITTEFEKALDIKSIMEENKQLYKDVIASLTYYKSNNITESKYKLYKHIIFSDELKRYSRSFNIISKYIGEYSESQEEYDQLCLELYTCFLKYAEITVGLPMGEKK